MDNLKDEIEKWTMRAKEKRKRIEAEKGYERLLMNIDAYISDSEYFLRKKNDLIRSFEAIIWSWAIMELGTEYMLLKEVPK